MNFCYANKINRLLGFSLVVLLISFTVFLCNSSTVSASELRYPSASPQVPGCLPWVVDQKTSGHLIVALQEDNCGGYFTLAYFDNHSNANFHVYVGAKISQDGRCTNHQSCISPYAGYEPNAKHQVCYYAEGGTGSVYTNEAYGCVNV